jgi:transglutaminase-like putative cysteine protease
MLNAIRTGLLSVVSILLAVAPAFCFPPKETPKYPVSSIPSDMKLNMNAVYWQDKIEFEILAKNRAFFRVANVITILNPNAKDLAQVVVVYDRLSKVTNLKGTIYNAQGEVVKKFKPSDIYDRSDFDGVTVFSDTRYKLLDMSHGAYPYTVEYEYEVDYRKLFWIPDFAVTNTDKVSSMHVEYTMIYPKDLKPRANINKIDIQPDIRQLGDNIEAASWRFQNVKPVEDEPYSRHKDLIPGIDFAPSSFEFDGYAGNMETWNLFGSWVKSLNTGRDNLPEATKQTVRALANEFSDPHEKVRALYQYMQGKTRYVSIQLGIGGYQPFDATVVDVNGYGDCKALSNYMVTLLQTVGIKAHYVLVQAGKRPWMNTNFPSSQFNHAIVCVPMKTDTVWLECTSQTNPFGYMGSFTGNRKALAIVDNGAVVVRTPVYSEKENLQLRNADVVVDANGNATAKIATVYKGIQYENGGLHSVLDNDAEGQKKWVMKNTDIPTFDLKSFSITYDKNTLPSANVNLNIVLNNFATVSGKRLFLTPNLMNRYSSIPPKIEDRKTPVVLNMAYTDIDTIRYKVPEEIYPEYLPEPVKLESRFGKYEASYSIDQGEIIYSRKFIMKSGEFPVATYAELTNFLQSVSRADKIKIVFLNKT